MARWTHDGTMGIFAGPSPVTGESFIVPSTPTKTSMTPLTTSILYSLFVKNAGENWVFSPASYLEAMSSLAVCIKGQNLAELVAAAPDIDRPQAIGLDTYNCLLYSAEYRAALNEAVLDVLHSRGGELRSFSGLEVVEMVNTLVREKTHGKIDNLISARDINEFTKFIILNCVYFKKEWVHPFNEDGDYSRREFKGATKTSKVRFLYNQIVGRRYYEGAGYDIVELLYKDSDVACYLIVPTSGSLFDVFSNLPTYFGHIADVKPGLDVNLTVPPFKTETTIDLKPLTKQAGVTSIFEANQDWSLVDLERLASGSWMQVSFIRQKAYIDFTKKGTEAAAATAIGMLLCSGCMMFQEPPPVKTIRADKPFVYVLAHKSEPTKPLFVGVVNDVPDSPEAPPRESYSSGWMPALSGILRLKTP